MDGQFFEVSQADGVLVVTPLRNVGSLAEIEVLADWERVLSQLEYPGRPINRVVIDFSRIEYFGSAMIEALLVLWKRISARHGKLAVCGCNHVCTDILRLARFDLVWPICPTLQDALDEVG